MIAGEPQSPAIKNTTPAEVRALLEDPIGSPLANDPRSGKSSLGGVQPKVVLDKTAHGWAQALGGYPTTHILKPRLTDARASVIYDEEYGSRIARRLGLAGFATSIEDFDGLPAIVIERYDRHDGQRLHQEDFSQALGASRNQKYQQIGDVVSFQRIAETLKTHAPEQDLRRLARMVVLAVGIGNLDLHTKKLGLLHPADGDVTLAPAHDVVPQTHLANDGRMALAVNGKYRHPEIARDDVLAEFAAWGLRRAATTVAETLDELLTILREEAPLEGAVPHLDVQLQAFVDSLISGSSVGGRSQ